MKTVSPFDLNIPMSFFRGYTTYGHRKFENVYKTSGFIDPILVDKDLNVLNIDDCYRVHIMREHNANHVIVAFLEQLDKNDLSDVRVDAV